MRGAEYGLTNKAAPLYMEYVMRQSLSKIGFTDSLDNLDCFTAECFSIIAQEIAAVMDKKSKAASKKGRTR